MILVIYILTPFTMTSTLNLFQGFRIIQTRMMVLAVIHGLRPNQKLKSILEGCTDLTHLWGSTLHAHNLFSKPFFQPQSVYIRFTHIMNMQPKLYVGLQCTTLWIANTVAPENFSNSTTIGWSRLSWLSATGKSTTICIAGRLSQYTLNERTTDVSSWP